MWLEYFGTVDERIFIGFGVVSGIICILTVANSILTCFQKHRPPGHSGAQCLLYSMVVICATVLFRGVQPRWSSLTALRPLCPVFTALMLVGYTAFTASVMTQSWALVIKHKWNAWNERKAIITVWILVTMACVSIVVWLALFSPDVTQILETSAFSDNVYMCGGWQGTVQQDYQQTIWRVTFTVYFAFLLVLAIISIPFHCTLRLTMETDLALRTALSVIIINSTLCVIVGLVVWNQLDLDAYNESYKYAIIGGLQLWMLVVSQVSLLVAQMVTRSHTNARLYSFNKMQEYDGMSVGGDSDKVSVSDGDGTLNINAINGGYYG